MRRRRYLVAVAASAGLLAGCTDSEAPTPTSQDGTAMQDRFERNIKGVDDPRIEENDGVVTLNYSVETVNRSAIEDQTRSVAIAWSQVVGAGWDVERLEVAVTAGDTVILSYHIMAEWAAKWNNRTISPAEYERLINGTVETATPTAAT